MANKTHFKVMTPNGIFMDEDIYLVTVRTPEGDIGLQHGKSPFVASLEIAEMIIYKDQGKQPLICAIAGGLVYVTPESVQIITDAVEHKDKIEMARAEKEKATAEALLKQAKLDESEILKAQISLKKAINRISVKKL